MRHGDTLTDVRTLVSDPPPAEFEALLEQRRRWGADRRDEVWEGVLHLNPAPDLTHGALVAQLIVALMPVAKQARLLVSDQFNLGEDLSDYRIPDVGLHRNRAGAWLSSAALAAEILSPGDETWDKLPFYADHHVDELLIIDPAEHAVHWLALDEQGEYQPVERSRLIDLGPARLAEQLDWA